MAHTKLASALALAILLAVPATALSQAGDPAPESEAMPDRGVPEDEAAEQDAEEMDDARGGMHGMGHHGRYGRGGMDRGSGMAHGMSSCPMMHDYMAMHSMMHAMHHGMRGGMKRRHGMGMRGMQDRHAMKGRQGMHGGRGDGHWFGTVRPMRHLSVEDVRHHFEHRLERYGNDRLKLGQVRESGKESIVAEIVTVDDSLVERLEVDRHSGRVRRAE